MFRYMLVLVDWMVLPRLKYSDEASGPMTGVDFEVGRVWR